MEHPIPTHDSGHPTPAGQPPLRIVACDDHPLFRRAVVTSLEDAGFNVVAEAASGVEGFQRAIDHAPDVVLMDLRMPNGTGVEATAAIRRHRPWTRVLVLTVSDDLDELVSAFAAGAVGHLRKEESMAVLPEAVNTVHDGGVILGPALARAIKLEVEGVQRRVEALVGSSSAWALTDRQADLLDRLAEGADVAAAAAALGIHEGMARTELRAVVEGLHRLADMEASAPSVDS